MNPRHSGLLASLVMLGAAGIDLGSSRAETSPMTPFTPRVYGARVKRGSGKRKKTNRARGKKPKKERAV